MAGLTSDFVGLTIELKPRRRNKRSVLYDLTPEYNKATGTAQGSWSRLEARHIHMLLQNELFINVATAHNQDGELRGQIKALLYNGLEAPRHGTHRPGLNRADNLPADTYSDLFFRLSVLPVALAGQFVSPPVRTGASGHAWVSVDKQCHLNYEIIVAGLSKSDDITVNAHLHGLAEIGELDDSSAAHKRLLTGFYGSQVRARAKPTALEHTCRQRDAHTLAFPTGSRSVEGHQRGITAAPGPRYGLHPGQHQDEPKRRNPRTGTTTALRCRSSLPDKHFLKDKHGNFVLL